MYTSTPELPANAESADTSKRHFELVIWRSLRTGPSEPTQHCRCQLQHVHDSLWQWQRELLSEHHLACRCVAPSQSNDALARVRNRGLFGKLNCSCTFNSSALCALRWRFKRPSRGVPHRVQ